VRRLSSIFLVFLFAFGALAVESNPASEKAAAKMEKRPKKITICSTCGRPENKCECDEKEEKPDEHGKNGEKEEKDK
jgi:hypothetical protein